MAQSRAAENTSRPAPMFHRTAPNLREAVILPWPSESKHPGGRCLQPLLFQRREVVTTLRIDPVARRSVIRV